MNSAAYQIDGRDVSREAFYAAACEPRRHVCVEACAGAGKTWMLVARIVRALLDGAAPQEILAITFTRKAAGEMRTRLADMLSACAAMTLADAAQELGKFGLTAAEAQQRAADLIGLHERVLDSGREVEVRTMHAWYAQLLAAAPIDLLHELGLAPGLQPLEDAGELQPTLLRAFQQALVTDAPLRADYRRLALRHGRWQLGQWLDAALSRRAEIELADAAGVLEPSVPPAAQPDPLAGLREADFVATARAWAAALGRRDKYVDKARKAAAAIEAALQSESLETASEHFRSALFTHKGEPLKQLGDLPEQLALCEAIERIRSQIEQQDAHEDHVAMCRLSRLLFAQYAQIKQHRGVVDMVDLERVALALLSQHTLAGWVQERLDARVRHLLIDEFQDTSPLQWHALQGWLDAYAGAGGGALAPRLFIVGDPKQSIYRFRRAEPRVFEAAQRFVVEALEGSVVSCDHTRRCAPGVVDVVNRVFGRWDAGHGPPGWRDHTTEIAAALDAPPPLVCLPSVERPARGAAGEADPEPTWRPSLTQPRVAAQSVLRDAEAATVAQAIVQLIREGVAAQDILVLARRRAVLQSAADALAAQHVAHVAPEELKLGELPEVQDLLAMLDALASPTQALSLARALKSPLFSVTDDELLALSKRARETEGWWSALMACADDPAAAPALQRAARLSARWAAAAPALPPHDLLDRIVHEGDLMARLAAAAPPERRARALDAVRALLAAALDLDGGRYASPYGFVRALRTRPVAVPASQQDGAVRLLTIHGAKGLEARVVFLMDAQAEPAKSETMSLLVDWPVHAPHPTSAAFVASHARCPRSLQALLSEELAARAREEVNLLYVALTRAQQRLFVSRTPARASQEAQPSWWTRLLPLAAAWSPIEAQAQALAAPDVSIAVVAWPRLHRVPAAAPPMAAPAADDAAAAALGQAIHRTLEWAAHNADADLAVLARAAAAEFGVVDAARVHDVAQRVLASPACRRFFDAAHIAWAANEVAVVSASGALRRIDRLVLLAAPEHCWWVLDYKLARAPQGDAALRAQLAEYRQAVAALVPGQAVRAAFVTAAGELVEPAP